MNLVILFLFLTLIIVGSITIVQAQEDNNIPSWIKQTALWWGEGKINDSEFITSMEYLVNNDVVKITESKNDRYIEKYKAWAKKEIQKWKNYSEELKTFDKNIDKKINNLEIENTKLKNEIRNQQSKYDDEYKYSTSLETDYDKLLDDYNLLVNDYNNLDERRVSDYNKLVDNYNQLDEYVTSEERKPRTTIIGGEISWNFYDSKGNQYSWSMPITTYEAYVKYDRLPDRLRLHNTVTDETYTTYDIVPLF